jgi:hypothetical protein
MVGSDYGGASAPSTCSDSWPTKRTFPSTTPNTSTTSRSSNRPCTGVLRVGVIPRREHRQPVKQQPLLGPAQLKGPRDHIADAAVPALRPDPRPLPPPHPHIVGFTRELLKDHRQRFVEHPRGRKPDTQCCTARHALIRSHHRTADLIGPCVVLDIISAIRRTLRRRAVEVFITVEVRASWL